MFLKCLSSASHFVLQGDTVRIGCSSGFWGDTSVSATQLVKYGNIDFLIADYLSEITMSLLTAAKRKNPDLGYTPDFIRHCMKPLLKDIKKQGVRVVANAGGINSESCVKVLKELAQSQGIELSVAMVTGDDMMKSLDAVRDSGLARDIESGNMLPKSVLSMNAYLGGFPIAKALDSGAEVVITGRCVDSALALGPLIHKFGWKETDYDLLASGSLAGHLIECGAQLTGGIFTDWEKVDGWDNIGFPIVECSSDGLFIVTKPPDTGGVVSSATVAEQLVYEIGDPTNYILPDVSCDFTHVTLKSLQEPDTVLVQGAIGKSPTPDYKVSSTYVTGCRAAAAFSVIGPKAKEKAIKTAEAILSRTRRIFKENGFKDYSRTHVHAIGSNQSYGPHSSCDSREIVMWLAVQHEQKEALDMFVQEIAPAGTGMAPGLTNMFGGRPRVSPVLKLFSFLYPKDKLPVTVTQDGNVIDESTYKIPAGDKTNASTEIQISESSDKVTDGHCLEEGKTYHLQDLAYLRSGDKGDSANIGVIARRPEYYSYIKNVLTEDAVISWFEHFLEPKENQTVKDLVQRYELGGIHGLNFVLKQSLGGGGVSSLRVDPQGKGYAQMLAEFPIQYKTYV